MNSFLKLSFVIFLAFVSAGLMTSCSDTDESLVSVEDFVGASVFSLESQGKIGRGGCFEFVFPVTIILPDGESASVEDYDSLKETIKAWKEANPDSEERPTFGFPLEVTSEDGDIASIADLDELKELRKTCRRQRHDGRWSPGRKFKDACFDIVYPLTISFPNGSQLEAANAVTLKEAIRAWKETVENPEGRPMLVFPITVSYEDGTEVSVADREALKDLKDQCDDGE